MKGWIGLAAALALHGWTASAQIVGGGEAEVENYPWQIGLAIDLDGQRAICGGALISPHWVLSAAHCFVGGVGPDQVRSKSGVGEILTEGDWSVVEKVIPHEGFVPETFENDIALVKLRRPVETGAIKPAASSFEPPEGAWFEVTGWGAIREGGAIHEHLQMAATPFVPNTQCNEPQAYGGRVAETMLCAGFAEGGVDACQGDSGGPLVWRGPYGPVLVGVVSWGEGCARPDRYGVYTRVSAFQDWIERTLAAEGG